MSKHVTMQDIADALGITKVSVSKALSGKPGISDALRAKIASTAEQMGYVAPKSHSVGKSYTIGFVVTKRFFLETDRFYNIIHYHINKSCMQQGHKLVLIVLSEAEENGLVMPDVLCNENLDGVFLVGQLKDAYAQAALQQISSPLVAVDFYRDALDTDYILADNFYLGHEAAQQLIAAGHRNLGFVGNIFSTSSICDRFFGFAKALAANNLPICKEWFISNNNPDTGEYTENIQLPDPLPTGFVCHCERAAYFLKLALDKRGISIPEDVSVIAFDNTDIGKTAMQNLTTFDISRKELAEKALAVMLRRIAGDTSAKGRHYVHSTIIRRSSIKKPKQT